MSGKKEPPGSGKFVRLRKVRGEGKGVKPLFNTGGSGISPFLIHGAQQKALFLPYVYIRAVTGRYD